MMDRETPVQESPTEESLPVTALRPFEDLNVADRLAAIWEQQCRQTEAINQIGEMLNHMVQGTAGVFEMVEHLKAQNFSPASLLKAAMGGKF